MLLSLASAVRAQEAIVADAVLKLDSATALERKPPRFPVAELSRGVEGWVLLAFTVTEDGGVRDPVIEDSSGSPHFEKAALEAVLKWRYKPAMSDGNPVEQSFTRNKITFGLDPPADGARRSFVQSYKQVAKLISDARLDEASIALDGLKQNGLSGLYEDAWYWFLRSGLEGARGDNAARLRSLRRAIAYEGKYLPDRMYLLALRDLYVLEVNTAEYAEALRTWDMLSEAEHSAPVVAELREHVVSLRALIAGEAGISVQALIDERGHWQHRLVRNEFQFERPEGALEQFDLLCDHKRRVYAFAVGQSWRIPASWGDCSLYVRGTPGARFQLIELADAPAASRAAETSASTAQ